MFFFRLVGVIIDQKLFFTTKICRSAASIFHFWDLSAISLVAKVPVKPPCASCAAVHPFVSRMALVMRVGRDTCGPTGFSRSGNGGARLRHVHIPSRLFLPCTAVSIGGRSEVRWQESSLGPGPWHLQGGQLPRRRPVRRDDVRPAAGTPNCAWPFLPLWPSAFCFFLLWAHHSPCLARWEMDMWRVHEFDKPGQACF